MEVMNSINY